MKTFQVGKKVWYLSGYRLYVGEVVDVKLEHGCQKLQRVTIKSNSGSIVTAWDYDVYATDEDAKKAIKQMIENLNGDLYLMEYSTSYQIDWQNE